MDKWPEQRSRASARLKDFFMEIEKNGVGEDPIDDLCSLLNESGAKLTFDMGRSNTHPCTFCGTPAALSHELITIGTYPNGEDLTRPVCQRCKPIALAKGNATRLGPVQEAAERSPAAARIHELEEALLNIIHEWDTTLEVPRFESIDRARELFDDGVE